MYVSSVITARLPGRCSVEEGLGRQHYKGSRIEDVREMSKTERMAMTMELVAFDFVVYYMVLIRRQRETAGSSTRPTLPSTSAITTGSSFSLPVRACITYGQSENIIPITHPIFEPSSEPRQNSSSFQTKSMNEMTRFDERQQPLSTITRRPTLNATIDQMPPRGLPHYTAQKQCLRLDSNQRLCITSIRLAPAGHK